METAYSHLFPSTPPAGFDHSPLEIDGGDIKSPQRTMMDKRCCLCWVVVRKESSRRAVASCLLPHAFSCMLRSRLTPALSLLEVSPSPFLDSLSLSLSLSSSLRLFAFSLISRPPQSRNERQLMATARLKRARLLVFRTGDVTVTVDEDLAAA